MIEHRCLKCGAEIEAKVATGRPKDYCSIGCRRAAESEIRRINLLLGKLESRLSHARLGWGSCSPKDIERVQAEIVLQETRLRTLLDAEA